jgi:hypothetical protein
METLQINSNELRVSFKETKTANDPEPNLCAYCTQYPNQFNVQIRGSVPLHTDKNLYKKGLLKRNLIATISLSKDEILRLADFVKNYTL